MSWWLRNGSKQGPKQPMVLGALVWLVFQGCERGVYEPPPAASIPVQSEVIVAGPFQPALRLLGRVEPAVEVEIQPVDPGRIRYPSRFAGGFRTGEGVARGELLFEVENEGIRLEKAEAELALRAAEAELGRVQRSFEAGIVSDAEREQAEIAAERAREQLESTERRAARLRVRAPVSGRLQVAAVVPPGSEVVPGQRLGRIAGAGLPRIEAWAAAADLERLAPGLEVRCLPPRGDEIIASGRLREVAGQVDASGTARLVAEITEDVALPPAGEGVLLEVLLPPRPEAVTLPLEALLVDGGVASAYVLETSGSEYRARRRLLLTGSRSEGRIEVLQGLEVGERVAVQGAEFLADGLQATEAAADPGEE